MTDPRDSGDGIVVEPGLIGLTGLTGPTGGRAHQGLTNLPAGWSGTRILSTGSTNADLLAAAAAGAPHGRILSADEQTAGRGRLGRSWVTPPGSALAVSVLLRPRVDRSCWTWLPLLAGLAVADALADLAPELAVSLKWPNDVLVDVGGDGDGRNAGNGGQSPDARKLAGILAEQDATRGVVVVGIGLNVTVPAVAFPAGAHASSLAAAGAPAAALDRELLLRSLVGRLASRYALWERTARPDDPSGGAAADYRARCATLGRRVRIDPAAASGTTGAGGGGAGGVGRTVAGVAVDIAADGGLVVDRDGGSEPITVRAGDVHHLRPQ